jgi:hypothetical protein
VAYLDLVPAAAAPPEEDEAAEAEVGDQSARVNGVCLPVDDAVLRQLDRRERNYERTDISERVKAGGARVWAYIGMAEARARLAEGRRTGTAVIDAGYVATVEAGFAAFGDDELATVRTSLTPGELPVVQLTRHELL